MTWRSVTSEYARLHLAFGSDWPLIWATRDRIAHRYAFIERELIEATIAEDFPEFEVAITRLLDAHPR